jgi:hypothetical protein
VPSEAITRAGTLPSPGFTFPKRATRPVWHTLTANEELERILRYKPFIVNSIGMPKGKSRVYRKKT